ncbi:aerial mycelium formation protein [Saccharomonospora sp. CUA-673]|uniref:RsiG family protein n=1 Tax=Saccharomonospora sp. CUA-673 TaxID=1904969 RepID=UPI00095EE60D|nr:aerial mycelium formation protein [Saccharomonospora sp. CUA-673]OLT38643.1 aerial mycelium formation protein [Saccharomonospora sp. CUA-673]
MIEVRPGGRRRIDRVLAPGYASDPESLPLPTLRERRDEAAQEETDLSYLRRLLHARIDIVKAEQLRRTTSTGDEDADSQDVVARLTAILSDNALGPATGSGRHQTLEPTRAGEYRRAAEALVGDANLSDVVALTDDQLRDTLASYGEQEASVSQRRREVQGVVDAFNAELARRYAQGTASVDELLDSQRGSVGGDSSGPGSGPDSGSSGSGPDSGSGDGV